MLTALAYSLNGIILLTVTHFSVLSILFSYTVTYPEP